MLEFVFYRYQRVPKAVVGVQATADPATAVTWTRAWQHA